MNRAYALVAAVAICVMLACSVSPSEVTARPFGSVARHDATGEGYQLDTVTTIACGPGTHGEYPDCIIDDECTQWLGSCSDPCLLDPGAAGCGDYCSYHSSDPDCNPDPCTIDPGGSGCGGGGNNWGSTEADTACTTTADGVITNPAVMAAMSDLWRRSNYMVNGTVQPFANRTERGAFIIQDGAGLRIEYFPDSWANNACSVNVPPGTQKPAGTIAFIHTHPMAKGELMVCPESQQQVGTQIFFTNYGGGSSQGDTDASITWEIPGYMIDANHVARWAGQSADTFFGRCGY